MKTFEDYLMGKHAEQYTGLDDEMPEDFNNWITEEIDAELIIDYAEKWHKSLSLCHDCIQANVSCPIYPQKTRHCVEYTKSN